MQRGRGARCRLPTGDSLLLESDDRAAAAQCAPPPHPPAPGDGGLRAAGLAGGRVCPHAEPRGLLLPLPGHVSPGLVARAHRCSAALTGKLNI